MRTKTRKITTTRRESSEAQEQKLLFEWAEYAEVVFPELQLMFHIVNEGKRSHWAGYELRKQGMRAGVPDICLPVPRGKYAALYIEMKRENGGRLSDAQKWWLEKLTAAGNLAVVCHGFESAKMTILDYLKNTK